MKKITLILFAIFSLLITSCTTNDDYYNNVPQDISYVVHDFDLWEVDHTQTTGTGAVPFLDRAITVSFFNGVLYANNNFSGFGYTGNGYGIDVGYYGLSFNTVSVRHDIYGNFNFEIYYVSQNTIQLYDRYNNIRYTLNGYNKAYYNYDYVFYNNIDYFLQEFEAWRKVYTSQVGIPNAFDNENILRFDTQGNIFMSSLDAPNVSIGNIYWDYQGVYDIFNTNNLTAKILRLDYGIDGIEEFYLTVINDNRIRLEHTSGTIYEFEGTGYIQFLRPGYKTTQSLKNSL